MKGKKGNFTENFPQLDLKPEQKRFLDKDLKKIDGEFLRLLEEIFSSAQQKILNFNSFLNFVLEEVNNSSNLLSETSNTIKKEIDPWQKRAKLQALSDEITNLKTITHDLIDIAQLQFQTIKLHPKKTNITNLITEHISKNIKNSIGPRILPNFPLKSTFFVVDENRFKTLIEDILNLSESLLKNKGTILIEISDSESELTISTITHPVNIQTEGNLSGLEFLYDTSEDLKTNFSKIFAYRIETITNLLGADIHLYVNSPESLQINLIFSKE